jgi:AmmeMemoRadiSam system protein B
MTLPWTPLVGRVARVLLVGLVGVTGCSRSDREAEPVRETSSETVREPVVAGAFYPGDANELKATVDALLAKAAVPDVKGLKALVCPHAGYRYSGPVAASGFKLLLGHKFDQVMVLAPSHHVVFRGVAVPKEDAMSTPLGKIRVARRAREAAQTAPFVLDSAPYVREHSLEVELPFLQRTLPAFELWPLVFGSTNPEEVAKQLDQAVGPTMLLVASTDLSHYYPYDTAVSLDRATIDAIVRMDMRALADAEACGRGPVLALAYLARSRGWKAQLLDYRNSGDTAGDRSRVVGYAAIAFYQPSG